MTTPINTSILRARQFLPQFAGTQPDAVVAQAHAQVAIAELLQLILMQLQQQSQRQMEADRRMASAATGPKRSTRSREMLDAVQ